MPSTSGSGGNLGIAAYLANGFKMSYSSNYFNLTRIGNVVYMNGDCVSTGMATSSSQTGTTSETLPYGFRPANYLVMMAVGYDGGLQGFWKWIFTAATGTSPESATYGYYVSVTPVEFVGSFSWITADPWSAAMAQSGITTITFN